MKYTYLPEVFEVLDSDRKPIGTSDSIICVLATIRDYLDLTINNVIRFNKDIEATEYNVLIDDYKSSLTVRVKD